MARIAKTVRVEGRVQGVFFRAWTREQAERLGVAGWVRNCADGRVEAHVEGEERAVSALIDAMRDGPSGAQVRDLRVEDAEAEQYLDFSVRH
jgi:acylphosphatase